MKKSFIFLLLLLSMLINVSVAENAYSESTIQLTTKEGIGNFIADSKGMALYYFTKDSPGVSVCVEGCLEKWPIFYAEKIVVGAGLKAKDFNTITRENGKKQTTFKGYPLYYFFKDKNPGDTFGQGVNNVWYVIDPKTFKPEVKAKK
ncbi:MAG: hypothetical protein LLF28_02990 [Nitrospiraceae bacterium]|nr:hypothetical protein [Nitrospiraceae bacterium]